MQLINQAKLSSVLVKIGMDNGQLCGGRWLFYYNSMSYFVFYSLLKASITLNTLSLFLFYATGHVFWLFPAVWVFFFNLWKKWLHQRKTTWKKASFAYLQSETRIRRRIVLESHIYTSILDCFHSSMRTVIRSRMDERSLKGCYCRNGGIWKRRNEAASKTMAWLCCECQDSEFTGVFLSLWPSELFRHSLL